MLGFHIFKQKLNMKTCFHHSFMFLSSFLPPTSFTLCPRPRRKCSGMSNLTNSGNKFMLTSRQVAPHMTYGKTRKNKTSSFGSTWNARDFFKHINEKHTYPSYVMHWHWWREWYETCQTMSKKPAMLEKFEMRGWG